MSLQVWLEKSFHKIFPNETPKSRSEINIYAAKNEKEACQLILLSDHDTTVALDFAAMSNASGYILEDKTFEILFLEAGSHGTWIDPMRPIENNTVSLKGGEAKAILWRFDIKKDAPAGEYKAKATAKAADGTSAECEVTLNVWNFTLPDTPSCQSAFGLGRDILESTYGLEKNSPESQAMYEKYYNELLDHKISAYNLPVDILSDEADKYMDDPRITSFVIPYVDSDEKQNQYLAKLRKKREWFKKGYFYIVDEPSTKDVYKRLNDASARLTELEPNFRQVVPFYMNPQFDIRMSAVENMYGKVRVWCPESCSWDDLNGCDKVGRGVDNTLGPKMLARQAAGETVWWYVCCGPRAPYCNVHITMEGIIHRILFWQQKMKRVEGLLYWSTNYWGRDDWGAEAGTKDPWTDMATVKGIDPDLYGDGSMFYPGPDGPCPSFRLECIRDGIEDFEYLTMAADLFGYDFVDDLISQVATSLTVYNTDEDNFENARIRLGQAIEDKLNK